MIARWITGSVVALLLLPVAFVWHVMNWLPEEVESQLHGATPDEVRSLLGEPTHSCRLNPGCEWTYTRPLRAMEVRVSFSAAGRVDDIRLD